MTTSTSSCRKISAGLVFLIAVITITPLCGLLFACGCTWPGLGLDARCDIHDLHALHPCPWCASMTMGLLSTGVAMLSGMTAAGIALPGFREETPALITRLIIGLTAFLTVAVAGGLASAWLQNHPFAPNVYLFATAIAGMAVNLVTN